MSTDYNDINMLMVKKIIIQIVRPFVHMCNVSFQTGVFPDKMKIAKVVPLFKSGEKNVFTNYRPISLLPQFSKILEKLYNERMDTFLNKHDILSPSQYGFRSNMSTSQALLDLTEEITSSLDNKKYSVGIFIDLKKAFDTIDHDILAKKIYFYGVRGIAHKWLLSYLEDRKQFVHFNNYNSETLNVSCGVPQGSILGSKLFSMYINDICKVSKIFKFILFADDTNIFCCDSNLDKLLRVINAELEKIHMWFSANRLSLNVAKTNYMFFGKRKLPVDISIKINKEVIKRVSVTNFLGVMIDDKLTWKHHIDLVKSKLSRSCAVMYRASFLIDRRGMHVLYFSLFLPYIMYYAEILGNSYSTSSKCLFMLQKRVIRLICGATRMDHTNMLFYDQHILKLPDVVKLKTAIIMFKAFHNLLPVNAQQLFSIYESAYTIRQNSHFKHYYSRTTLKGMCISITGVKLWNSLDNSLKNCRNVHLFKKYYTNRLLKSYVPVC